MPSVRKTLVPARALLVLRSIGGAGGSTVAGAIIASGLIEFQKSADGSVLLAVGSVQKGSAALAHVARTDLTGASAHLGWSFSIVYAMAGLFAAVSFLVSLRMPNTPLRESLHANPISE